MATGFTFGNFGKAATTSAPGLTLGTPATTVAGVAAPAAGGFNPGASSGFKLNTPGATGSLAVGGLGTSTSASTGFSLGGTTSTAGSTAGGFGAQPGIKLPTATTTAATTGFSLGVPAAPTSTGLTLGATTSASTGFSLGGGLGGLAATTKPGLTLGGPNTTITPGLSLGATSSALGGTDIFATTTTTASRGLGGIDPKTATSTSGSTSTTGKPSDAKAIKETALPPDVCLGVSNFRRHLKSQKSEREEIARVSQTPLSKVQEDVASLRQLLAVVSNGLQRNTVAVNKLKAESAQELKYAEVAQRTKDTPPGLQYENTAPIEYFHSLVEDFEGRMLTYRQQIEELESHLASLSHSGVLTPQELSVLFHKVHNSFVALAAQLQMVHETVKVQKEHYLNWRRVFHGETIDIFEKRRKIAERLHVRSVIPVTTVGPTPFTALPNSTAMAMASAINRTQPTGAPTIGLATSQPTLTGLLGGATTTASTGLFGTAATNPSSVFGGLGGGSVFGSTAKTQTQAVAPFNLSITQPLGSSLGSSITGGTSLFGSTAAGDQQKLLGVSFGAPATAPGVPGSTINTPVAGEENKPFQLQRPPQGNKRGKRI